ncbi:MAG: conjugal transfer protein [Solirubrobacteraceae bacterium]|nr:conjugal transfer protein [Solirubrobacteraceae bacterium]
MLLWALLLLVLMRGVGDIVSDAGRDQAAAPLNEASSFPGDAERAFAVGVGRAYLSWRAGADDTAVEALDGLLAPSLRGRFARALPTRGKGQAVVEAVVAGSERVAPGRALITVACTLASGEQHHVVVPVARDGAGGLVAFDLPALVAGPQTGAVDVSEPSPLSGPGAQEIERLVGRFLAAYLAGAGQEDLAFFVASGARVGSLAPGLELAEVSEVGRIDRAEDEARATVVATVRLRDTATRAVYPARYRLDLVRLERWYVASVAGELS